MFNLLVLKSLILLIRFALCTKSRPLEMFHQYIFTFCVSLKWRTGGVAHQAGGQLLPLDNWKANDFSLLSPSLLYIVTNFVKAVKCCHSEPPFARRHLIDSSLGFEWRERPIGLRRAEQIFDDFLRLCLFRGLNFTLGCDEHLVIITNKLVHWCFDAIYLYLRSFFWDILDQ